jgi:hypothetical protein
MKEGKEKEREKNNNKTQKKKKDSFHCFGKKSKGSKRPFWQGGDWCARNIRMMEGVWSRLVEAVQALHNPLLSSDQRHRAHSVRASLFLSIHEKNKTKQNKQFLESFVKRSKKKIQTVALMDIILHKSNTPITYDTLASI